MLSVAEKYLKEMTLKPNQKELVAVNVGAFVIYVRDESLEEQLREVEDSPCIISWNLMREWESVLVDTDGRYFACTEVDGKDLYFNELSGSRRAGA